MPHREVTVKGEKYPSVTEIVGLIRKPYLETWRGSIGNHEADRICKESADLGTEVHSLIERFVKGESIKTCSGSKAHRLFKLFCDEFWLVYEPIMRMSEETLINKADKYQGTPDGVMEIPTGPYVNLWLVDFKVSKNKDHLRALQLAGYYRALVKTKSKYIPENGMIIRIDPKAEKVSVEPIKNLKVYVPLFLGLRKLWDFVNKKGVWGNGK